LVGSDGLAVELLLGAQFGLRQGVTAHGTVRVDQGQAQWSRAETQAEGKEEHAMNCTFFEDPKEK